ncbi:MAG: DUF1499 domain-containing protein [Panacagrimonas sp.]
MTQIAVRGRSIVLPFVACIALSGCGLGSANLRPAAGPLAGCDGGPHCVSSQSKNQDRRIAPISYSGTREEARRHLLAVLGATPRLKLVASTPDYVHAEITTRLMRYVDDVEFLFSPTQPSIDVRSSSRIGYYDFQTNRDRIEDIRVRFTEK